MKTIRTILHPTDFSEDSRGALKLAGSLARDHSARLIILHAVPRAVPVTGAGDTAALERAERQLRELKSYQQEMAEKLNHLDLPAVSGRIEYFLEEGDAATIILRKAEETSCDMIVMGTRGPASGLRKLMGSVAEKVMRDASCPVVIVKVPAKNNATQSSPEGEPAVATS